VVTVVGVHLERGIVDGYGRRFFSKTDKLLSI
jgi:hypothetical protein